MIYHVVKLSGSLKSQQMIAKELARKIPDLAWFVTFNRILWTLSCIILNDLWTTLHILIIHNHFCDHFLLQFTWLYKKTKKQPMSVMPLKIKFCPESLTPCAATDSKRGVISAGHLHVYTELYRNQSSIFNCHADQNS